MANKYITLSNLSTFKTNLDARMQAKLSTSNVNPGTLSQLLGFDSSGNLVRNAADLGKVVFIGSSTTYSEVGQILSDNKIPVFVEESSGYVDYFYYYYNTSTTYYFYQDSSPSQKKVRALNSTGWTTGTYNLQDKLTTTSVEDGTIDKVIGFNSGGTVVKSVINVVQDLTANTAGTLDAIAWAALKSAHTATIASATMTGLDANYEFVNIKLSINSVDQYVKLSKNINVSTPSSIVRYSGLFFIEESTNLYEITAYYNGTNIILRCATVK